MHDSFLVGVVEGFYGQPWTQHQRLELFDRMAAWGLNTYFYSPKDDLKHRALWRERYDVAEMDALAALVDACSQRGLTFIYGLSPGLNMRFSDPAESDVLKQRLHQLMEVDARDFALLFDDLPGEMSAADRRAYGSVAEAQVAVTNTVFTWLRERIPDSRRLFCPTPYCDRMVSWQLGGADYLDTVGLQLASEIDVLWTGPEIISHDISVESIQRLSERIQRPPVLWDNLHANDYDVRRLYCGPYSGRPPTLLPLVRGILMNPNNEFPVNYIPLRTLARFIAEPNAYEPRDAFLSAATEWLGSFETVSSDFRFDDLVLLADCYYLPFEEGREAESLYALVKILLENQADAWGDAYEEFKTFHDRVRRIWEQLTELKNRELFYAWSRRVWELREEMDLIKDFLERKRNGSDESDGIASETHLPRTYRGGIVARLQQQLAMDGQGRFRATGITSY